ncbi:MAG: DUF503 domain-containing protein [Dehalococcoidia bacterium]
MRRPEPAITAGTALFTFEVPAASLKEKRSIIRPLVERMRSRFNAAVVEAGPDRPDRAVIAAACLSTDGAHVQSQLQSLLSFVERSHTDAVLVDVKTDSFVI